MIHETEERSLIIIKPDAIQRSLVGEIITRFERKGLKIIGVKMMHLKDALVEEHYSHIKDKPFFPRIKRFMTSSPVIVMAVAGLRAIDSIRLIVGVTKSYEADAGTTRRLKSSVSSPRMRLLTTIKWIPRSFFLTTSCNKRLQAPSTLHFFSVYIVSRTLLRILKVRLF
jgi:nucleoside diphosphate kinase